MKKLSSVEMKNIEGGVYCRTTIHSKPYDWDFMWHEAKHHWDKQACQTKTVKGYCVLWEIF